MEICCIIWSGHGLDEKMRNLLFTEAQKLLKKDLKSKRINQSWCEGRIRTKKERRSLGGFYGYVFYADIEWEKRKTSITFLAKEIDGDIDSIDLIWTQRYFSPYGEINPN